VLRRDGLRAAILARAAAQRRASELIDVNSVAAAHEWRIPEFPWNPIGKLTTMLEISVGAPGASHIGAHGAREWDPNIR